MIRYEDDWLLVVDKPVGLPTQAGKNRAAGLYEQLCADRRYVGLHHRLDQPTSGLVLFTLQRRVNRAISMGFRSHTIGRTYRAVLWGEALDETWDWPIDGASAVTEVRVLHQGRGLSAVELNLQTGRTHQIRHHAAMAGTPVVGDRRYGLEAAHRWPRLALHAAELSFIHPVTDEPIVVSSPIPADLTELWSDTGATPQ